DRTVSGDPDGRAAALTGLVYLSLLPGPRPAVQAHLGNAPGRRSARLPARCERDRPAAPGGRRGRLRRVGGGQRPGRRPGRAGGNEWLEGAPPLVQRRLAPCATPSAAAAPASTETCPGLGLEEAPGGAARRNAARGGASG